MPSPSSCQDSADHINKNHEYYEPKNPGQFSHVNDFFYVMCFTAVITHGLKERMGLKGYTDKHKIAAHIFWKKMSVFFIVYGDKPVVLKKHFLEDFNGIIKFCQQIEDTEMVPTERGHLITEALFDQFAYQFFPPGLRGLERASPNALLLTATLKELKPIHPLFRVILLWG